MSFTVAQRTREIGIRSALGANPGRLVGEIFAGALRRLVLGVVLGGLAWLVPMAWLASVQSAPTDYARAVGVLVAVGAIVLGVALLACGIPAKRALSIEPTEALRGGS
jgi:ABC-type antimicrobial peptide transport system permease subunit